MTSPKRNDPERPEMPRSDDAGTFGVITGSPTAKLNRLQRRRAKISAEIERNRRGEHKVPTWVLFVILLVLAGAWAALVFLPR